MPALIQQSPSIAIALSQQSPSIAPIFSCHYLSVSVSQALFRPLLFSVKALSCVYCLGKITIGERVSISQYAHLCAGTHDFNDKDMPLLRPPITIEDDVWLAADSFVGPNVTVGEGAILGARAVAMRDLDPWTIYSGNPAIINRTRDKLN